MFGEKSQVNKHIRKVHVREEEEKLAKLEKQMSAEVFSLTKSVNEIMVQEASQKDKPCNCHRGASRTFCTINHGKHNWVKPKSQHFIEKLNLFEIFNF